MHNLLAPLAIGMAALPTAAEICDSNEGFTLMLHGGFLDYEAEVEPHHRTLFRELLKSGREHLAKGGSALDVVVDSIAALEDSGILNAGKGSIVNTAGFTETDASLMDGRSGRSGAVAAMQRLKNPIKASRLVMDETEHVLFAGTNGEQTLAGLGAELVKDPASYFQKYTPQPTDEPTKPKHGTVGAAALDRCGNLAAGTSTGGWRDKLPGRVGDSPIIGAGNYCDNRLGAAACTGRGELAIRNSTARTLIHYLADGLGVEAAAARAMQDIHALASFGGVNCLLMDAEGNTMSATTLTDRESIHWFMDTDSREPEKRTGINVRP